MMRSRKVNASFLAVEAYYQGLKVSYSPIYSISFFFVLWNSFSW